MSRTDGSTALETTGLNVKLRQIAVPVLFAALTALGGQVRVPVPGSPVPITLQVIVVLIAGAVMAPRVAAASMLLFALVGAAGAPVFHGGGAGPLHLMGPTGGYIIGFIAGAWVCSMTLAGRRDSFIRVALSMMAGVATIHLFGVTQLAIYYSGDLLLAARQGLFFFLPMDLVKVAIAASLVAGGVALFGKGVDRPSSLHSG